MPKGIQFFAYLILIIVLICPVYKMDIGLKAIDNLRIYGIFLQILGILLTISSLRKKLSQVKKDIEIALKSLVAQNETAVIPSVEDFEEVFNFNAIQGPEENPKDIIRYYNEITQQLSKKIQHSKERIRVHNNEILNIKGNFNNFKEEIKKHLHPTNYLLEFFGISCIILGIILGTIPDNIVYIISALFLYVVLYIATLIWILRMIRM